MVAARKSSAVGSVKTLKVQGARAPKRKNSSTVTRSSPTPSRSSAARTSAHEKPMPPQAAPPSPSSTAPPSASPKADAAPSALRRIDPTLVGRSQWANRMQDDAQTREFRELKASIQSAGGNVQPIKVRPVNPSLRDEGAVEFEIVFGHRRHQACLELGVPVNAIVVALDDVQLFSEMDRENRAHQPLSPFEQGLMFKLALEGRLFSSARRLAQDLGIDVSLVSKSIAIASLPAEVRSAFASPKDIQYRWARPLKNACTSAPEHTIETAKRLKDQNSSASISPGRIFKLLVHEAGLQVEPGTLEVRGKRAHASFKIDRRGRLAIWFDRRLSDALVKQLHSSLQKLLSE
jgi:ParB family chromosome partitioning protein